MKHRSLSLGLVALATGWMLVAGIAHADSWIKAQSEHFTIISDAPEKKTRVYVKKLEAFRTLTNMLLGASGNAPQTRFTLYLLADRDRMLVVRPTFASGVAGVYFNCAEGTSAYGTVSYYNIGDQDQGLTTLLHEYSHYVMFQHARTYYPAWYVEGFAEYLSTADPEKGTITIGEMSQGRDFTLAQDRWISFAKVLNPDFGFTGDKSNNPWEIESFYAQSWLLTHYMLSDDTRAKNLNAYFVRVGQGEDPVTAFESATGIKVASLQSLLQRYMEKTYYLKVPVPDYPDSQITVTPVDNADSAYLFDASLLTTCPPKDQGQAILSRLTALREANSPVGLRLAIDRGQILYGKASDAETDLNALTTADPHNFEANYLLGRLYFKEAEGKSGDDANALIDQARGAFITAYRLNKLDAPNLYFLARSFSDQPGFPDTNAVNAANGAHVLAPGVLDYAGFAAFTDLANNQREQAVEALEPFVGDPHNREQAQRIKLTVDAIKSGAATREIMRIMNGGTPIPTDVKLPPKPDKPS